MDQIKYMNTVIDIRAEGRRYRAFVPRADEARLLELISSKIDGKTGDVSRLLAIGETKRLSD